MNPAGRGPVAAWCLYDWANSAFTTLVVTFVYATYFTQAMAPDEVTGTALWSRAVGLTGILVALLSPVLGAMADRSGRGRRYLAVATGASILATAALTFVAPGTGHAVVAALALFVVANVAFEIGMVFYNALLPAVAAPERYGRVSGYGWALGYGGGLACLVVALAVLVRDVPLLGVTTEAGFNVRATNLLVAGWFAVFSLPLFFLLPPGSPPPPRPGAPNVVRAAFAELARTFREIRRYREVSLFLVARLVYNDGLITVFAFGGIYAAGTFGLELSEVIRFGIAINVAAGLGAWAFGLVDDRLGGRATVLITLAALVAFTLVAVFAPTREWLWVAGLGIGAFVGPNQAASRSLMARFVPGPRRSEFFGFFAFSGKATAFAGPLLLGLVTEAFDSQRAGVATVLVFFVAGGALLVAVDEGRGVAVAKEEEADEGASS